MTVFWSIPIRFAVVLAFTCPAQLYAGPSTRSWMKVERVSYPWNGGSGNYTFTIEAVAQGFLAAHPLVDSPRLRITTPDGASLIVSTQGGLVQALTAVADQALLKDNLLRSQYVYLTPKLRGPNHTPALIVFGWAFASDPGSIRIIELDSSGLPHIEFAHGTFLLADIVDLQGDAVAELVGRTTMTQQSGKCPETYDPFAAYRVDRSGPQLATYSEVLSRTYNLKHYVGWAGPLPNDRVVVVRPGHGPPSIVSIEHAEDLCN